MRTLFAKILAWFVATAAVTTVAVLVTTALTVSEPRNRLFPFSELIRIQQREAREAWEAGGRDALSAVLARIGEGGRLEGHLTDATGRDLVTGEDRSEWIRNFERQPSRPIPGSGRMVIARPSPDRKYWFFLEVPRRPYLLWFLHPQYLWILGVVVLFCYLLTRSLTAPVRQLQRAVNEFGQGDFSARVGSGRKDELGELARNFDRMAERIQTLMQSERRLLLDISHELRSPLARLGVAVELARTGEDREAALNRIQKEADRLNTLVGELLQVTRSEVDPADRKHDAIRLDELISETVEDCAIEALARDCAIRFDAPPEVTFAGDAELLRRAVENVIRNAVRFAPAGTSVEVTLSSNTSRVLIGVRDYGPGVPAEALTRIFDAFYRVEADRNRSSGGVGLGLAIARQAVSLHNGTLRARNTTPGLLVEIEFLR